MARHFKTSDIAQPHVLRPRWLIALVVWICVIWAHSLIPGPTSSEESQLFLSLVKPLFEVCGVHDVDLMHHLVRKAGHFSEYLVLGMIASTTFGLGSGSRRALIATCLVWMAVPCIDETIQLFVPERVGAFTDVLIDMSGYALGLVIRMAYRAVCGKCRR